MSLASLRSPAEKIDSFHQIIRVATVAGTFFQRREQRKQYERSYGNGLDFDLAEEAWVLMKSSSVQIVHALLNCTTNAVSAMLLLAKVNGSAPSVTKKNCLYDRAALPIYWFEAPES